MSKKLFYQFKEQVSQRLKIESIEARKRLGLLSNSRHRIGSSVDNIILNFKSELDTFKRCKKDLKLVKKSVDKDAAELDQIQKFISVTGIEPKTPRYKFVKHISARVKQLSIVYECIEASVAALYCSNQNQDESTFNESKTQLFRAANNFDELKNKANLFASTIENESIIFKLPEDFVTKSTIELVDFDMGLKDLQELLTTDFHVFLKTNTGNIIKNDPEISIGSLVSLLKMDNVLENMIYLSNNLPFRIELHNLKDLSSCIKGIYNFSERFNSRFRETKKIEGVDQLINQLANVQEVWNVNSIYTSVLCLLIKARDQPTNKQFPIMNEGANMYPKILIVFLLCIFAYLIIGYYERQEFERL